MEYLDIVDKNDKVIGENTRHDSYKNCTTNRIVSIIIFDFNGKIALQKRSKTCSYKPGYWGLSAGGHVSSGDSYKEAMKRELKEELGIDCRIKFKDKIYGDRLKLDKKYGENIEHKNHFFHWAIFEGIYDGDFSFDDGEVEDVKYFSLDEIKNMIRNKENITPGTAYILEKYYL